MTNGINYKASIQQQRIIWQEKRYISQPKKISDNSGQLHKFFANIAKQIKVAILNIGNLDT